MLYVSIKIKMERMVPSLKKSIEPGDSGDLLVFSKYGSQFTVLIKSSGFGGIAYQKMW